MTREQFLAQARADNKRDAERDAARYGHVVETPPYRFPPITLADYFTWGMDGNLHDHRPK